MNNDSVQYLNQRQVHLFNELLNYLKAKSPFYKSRLASSKNSISSVKDLAQFPITTKEDIQLYYKELLCVSKSAVLEYTATSGTLGKPITIPLTKADLNRLALNEQNSFQLMDLNSNDIVQLMLTLDKQFMAGMAYYLGAQALGATVIRTGPGIIAQQFEAINNYGSTCIVAVPSFLLQLIKYAQQFSIDLTSLPVKKILCIGEPIRNADFSLNEIGTRIRSAWDVELYSTYACTEMQTAFTECKHACGGHLQSDLLFLEVLNENGEHVNDGELGEIVITTFGVEAFPLLRYQTGDLAHYYSAKCACGRVEPRLGPIVGRQKQMIKYKGTTLYPQTIVDAIHKIKQVSNYIIEVSKNDLQQDELILHLSLMNPADQDEVNKLLQEALKVKPIIKLSTADDLKARQLPEHSRKAIKFVDNRKMR